MILPKVTEIFLNSKIILCYFFPALLYFFKLRYNLPTVKCTELKSWIKFDMYKGNLYPIKI